MVNQESKYLFVTIHGSDVQKSSPVLSGSGQ
jgi:hypothetical protein